MTFNYLSPLAIDHVPSSDDETFLDSLVDDSDDIVLSSLFGLETLHGLHGLKLQCAVNVTTIEVDFNTKMTKLFEYHRSMESVISIPQFYEFSNEDRQAIEGTFHRTLKHAEKLRNQKLQGVIRKCEKEQEVWLRSKFISAVEYAVSVLFRDPTRYREIIGKVESYKRKLQYQLWSCSQARHSVYLIYCYSEELEMILQQVDNFIYILQRSINEFDDPTIATVGSNHATSTTTISESHYDDEDFSASGEGSGMESEDNDDDSVAPTTKASPSSTTSLGPADATSERATPTIPPEVSVSGSQDGLTDSNYSEMPSTLPASQGEDHKVVRRPQS